MGRMLGMCFGLAAVVLVAIGTATAEEPAPAGGKPLGLYVAGEDRAPANLGLHDPTSSVRPTPIARPKLRVRNPRKKNTLGPVAKLRRGRYIMSLLKELKANKSPSMR